MKPACTYSELSVEKLMEATEKYLNGEKVDYTDKIKEFRRIGEQTLDTIIGEIEQK